MQWLKRERANDSLTEHRAIMGSKTKKKVLDYSCANKLCRICESAQSNGKEPAHHDCCQNQKGSSEVGVRLFRDSPNHGVKYFALYMNKWHTVYKNGLTALMQRKSGPKKKQFPCTTCLVTGSFRLFSEMLELLFEPKQRRSTKTESFTYWYCALCIW